MERNKLDKGTKNFFRTTLIGGLVVLLPLAIFYLLVSFLFFTVSGVVRPILGLTNIEEAFKYPMLVDLFAFLFIILVCFFVGLLVSTASGQKWVNRIEHAVLFKLPYYGTVREAVHQLLGNSNMNLFKVVLVDLYETSTLATAFLTDETLGEYCTVFVPTGPNPTSGFVFHVKRSQIIPVDVKAEVAIRSIIGVGTGSANILNAHFLYDQVKPEEVKEETAQPHSEPMDVQ